MKRSILVIDDEPQIAEALRDAFEFEGFRVFTEGRGASAIRAALAERPDAILLDLTLPDQNGYDVCKALRSQGLETPIIMLTARTQESDKIRGLDVGADDYVTKPFSVNELVARVRAVLRRTSRVQPRAQDVVKIGASEVHFGAQLLVSPEGTTELSFHEVEVLRFLLERGGQPVSRDELLSRVWGVQGTAMNRTVDNCVVKLRKKIEPQPDKPRHILTVYGLGYKLVTT